MQEYAVTMTGVVRVQAGDELEARQKATDLVNKGRKDDTTLVAGDVKELVICPWCGNDFSPKDYVSGELHFDLRCYSCGWYVREPSELPPPWKQWDGDVKEVYMAGLRKGKELEYIRFLLFEYDRLDPNCQCRICRELRDVYLYPENERHLVGMFE